MGFHRPDRAPPRYAYDLLSAVLGEGMSSRLFLELREERGLAYEAHSGTAHYRDAGAMEIYAAVDPKNAVVAMETILAELSKLKDASRRMSCTSPGSTPRAASSCAWRTPATSPSG